MTKQKLLVFGAICYTLDLISLLILVTWVFISVKHCAMPMAAPPVPGIPGYRLPVGA